VLLVLLAFVLEAWDRSRREHQGSVGALRDAWKGA